MFWILIVNFKFKSFRFTSKVIIMKNSLLLLFLFSISAVFAQNDVAVQTLNPQKVPNVRIKVPNSLIKHEAWENGGLRVDILISAGIPKGVLEALVEAGRYELDGKVEGEEYYNITAPNMDIPILIGESKLKEDIKITVTTPEYFAIKDGTTLYKDIDESVIRSRSDTREEMAAMLKKMRAIREDVNVHLKVVSTADDKTIDLATFKLVVGGKEMMADALEKF